MASVPRLFLAGLGNLHLPRTRHSLGQYLVDTFAERLGLKFDELPDGFMANGETTLLSDKPAHLFLFKAKEPMNVQGHAIAKASRIAEVQSYSTIILHDTMKLEPGRLKVKFGGEPDGHRGIRSVNKFLHTQDYHRIQLGIGRAGDAKEYVLGPLSVWEKNHYGVNGKGTDEIWEAVDKIAEKMVKLRPTDFSLWVK